MFRGFGGGSRPARLFYGIKSSKRGPKLALKCCKPLLKVINVRISFNKLHQNSEAFHHFLINNVFV